MTQKEVNKKSPFGHPVVIVGLVFFGLFVAGIVGSQFSDSVPTQKAEIEEEPKQVEGDRVDVDLSTEDEIRKLVSDRLVGENNMDKPYIREIDVVEQIDGGWGVFVEYNADDNLTSNLRKAGMEKKMSEIYTALYTSDQDIRIATVAAYFPLSDKFGATRDGAVYKTSMNKELADKVNWDVDSSLLELNILPGLWSASFLHPSI